jgi:hypothetical protein
MTARSPMPAPSLRLPRLALLGFPGILAPERLLLSTPEADLIPDEQRHKHDRSSDHEDEHQNLGRIERPNEPIRHRATIAQLMSGGETGRGAGFVLACSGLIASLAFLVLIVIGVLP